MIIVKDKYGQLCNRLWAYSPVISKALETGEKVDILNFYDYYNYFDDLEIFENINFRKKFSFQHRMFIRIPEKYMGLFKPLRREFWDRSNSDRLIFINSWAHKNITDKLKKKELRKLFTPRKIYLQKVDKIFSTKRTKFDIIIGVHIRKGDYKTFRNGIFYYSDEVYANFMRRLKAQFDHDRRIGFLICSNSSINISNFSGLDVFQLESPNLIEDLCGLSKCDFIMGPPSTYSMWASFYGEKPMRFLMNRNDKINIKDFKLIVSENTFSDGTKLNIADC